MQAAGNGGIAGSIGFFMGNDCGTIKPDGKWTKGTDEADTFTVERGKMEIQTERTIIRNLQESDYPEFEPSLNEIQRTCMGGARQFFDWLLSQYKNMDIVNDLISLGIFDRATGAFLGSVGVGKHDDLKEPEIFYELLPEYRGLGYATEAARALTGWVFENYSIPYLIATVAVDNVKSQRVLERIGYQFIDQRTLLVHVEGKEYDFRYYRYYPGMSLR